MKLQRINKFLAGVLILPIGLSLGCNKKVEEVEEEVFEEVPFEREFDEIDEPNLLYEISKLNIVDNNSYPSNIYKVMRFTDTYGYYRTMIVNINLNYILDDDGFVLGKEYTIRDAFSKEELFTTNDYENIDASNNYFLNAKIHSIDDLDELEDIALSNGASEEYVDQILQNKLNNSLLTPYDVAIMYVSLTNNNNRVTYETLENNKVMSK